MLILKDRNNFVRGDAFKLASRARLTELEVIEALKVLMAPDTRRIEPQPFEGRRIEKVEGGWVLLNGKAYQEEIQKATTRAKKAKWAAEHRMRSKLSPGEATYLKMESEGRSQAELDEYVNSLSNAEQAAIKMRQKKAASEFE